MFTYTCSKLLNMCFSWWFVITFLSAHFKRMHILLYNFTMYIILSQYSEIINLVIFYHYFIVYKIELSTWTSWKLTTIMRFESRMAYVGRMSRCICSTITTKNQRQLLSFISLKYLSWNDIHTIAIEGWR